jgi:hypothetical protein
MSSCEKCWTDAGGNPERYRMVLRERSENPCTPEQQAGPDGKQCPACKRMTLHQYTKWPMCGCKQT